jgi:hypothetical protein
MFGEDGRDMFVTFFTILPVMEQREGGIGKEKMRGGKIFLGAGWRIGSGMRQRLLPGIGSVADSTCSV